MPTLRQLEYLVTIADTGSFAVAARVAHVSQPTLSQQVRTLEERLGVKLLERSTAGAILTPVGRSIVATARRMLSDASDIVALAAGSANMLSGTLRLGTTPTLGPYLLSPIIAELHRMAPQLRLHVREGIPDEQLLELSRGNIDVLLGPLPMAGDDLTIEPLFREPLHLVAALDHPIEASDSPPREMLTGSALLTLDPRHHLARQAAEVAEQYGMHIAPDYYGTSLESLHQMVASGLGLALLPSLYLHSEIGGASGLKVLTGKGWRVHRSIAIAWRRQSPMSAAFKLIADHVKARAVRLLSE
ncbi:LysR family transcriptional regulator [Sphingomonas sp. PB1R3]|uniref:LysR family transcriptional regulator n=1 Tax=Sphingomonas flavida TaxID=3096154 RepID=UPI002FC6E5F6